MVLRALIPCVNYADFLLMTLPCVLAVSDEPLIITTPGDEDTRAVCRRYNVACFTLADWGTPFNKAVGLQAGLHKLLADRCGRLDWILALDADILLPASAKEVLAPRALCATKLYGALRRIVSSPEAWRQYRAQELRPRLEWPSKRDLRYLTRHFQLWNQKAHPMRFPAVSMPADYVRGLDVQWPEADRKLLFTERCRDAILPERRTVHLGEIGRNWHGRVTKPWFDVDGFLCTSAETSLH